MLLGAQSYFIALMLQFLCVTFIVGKLRGLEKKIYLDDIIGESNTAGMSVRQCGRNAETKGKQKCCPNQ